MKHCKFYISCKFFVVDVVVVVFCFLFFNNKNLWRQEYNVKFLLSLVMNLYVYVSVCVCVCVCVCFSLKTCFDQQIEQINFFF